MNTLTFSGEIVSVIENPKPDKNDRLYKIVIETNQPIVATLASQVKKDSLKFEVSIP